MLRVALTCALSDFEQCVESFEAMVCPGKLIIREDMLKQTLGVIRATRDLSTILGCGAEHLASIKQFARVSQMVEGNETALGEYGMQFRNASEQLTDAR